MFRCPVLFPKLIQTSRLLAKRTYRCLIFDTVCAFNWLIAMFALLLRKVYFRAECWYFIISSCYRKSTKIIHGISSKLNWPYCGQKQKHLRNKQQVQRGTPQHILGRRWPWRAPWRTNTPEWPKVSAFILIRNFIISWQWTSQTSE